MKHPDFPDTNCIHTFIGRVSGPSGGKWSYHLIEDHPISVLIPVADLPRLFINAILKDGYVQRNQSALSRNEIKESVAFDFKGSEQKIVHRFQHDEKNNKPYIPYAESPLIENQDALLNFLDKGESAVLQPGVDENAAGYFLLAEDEVNGKTYAIPCFEIFRFFYAVSSRLAEAVIAGHFRDPDHHLWSLKKSRIERKVGFLSLRKRMFDNDAPHIARFAFDPIAIGQAARIANELLIRNASGNGQILAARPPINGRTQLEVISQKFSENINVVTRILSCDWEPPFSQLIFERENDGQQVKNQPTDNLPATNWPPVYKPKKHWSNSSPIELSKAVASKKLSPTAITEAELSERFPKLAEIRAIKAEKFIQTTVSGKRGLNAVDVSGNLLSTISGSSSGEILQQAILTAQNPTDELVLPPKPVSPDQIDLVYQDDKNLTKDISTDDERPSFLRMIELFQAAKQAESKSGISIEFLNPLAEYWDNTSVPLSVFPRSIEGKKKKWCIIRERPELRRAALVVQITKSGRIRYLLEAQQRRNGEFSSLVLWSPSETVITQLNIRNALLECAKTGKLNLSGFCRGNGLHWARKRHSGLEDVEHYVLDLFTKSPED